MTLLKDEAKAALHGGEVAKRLAKRFAQEIGEALFQGDVIHEALWEEVNLQIEAEFEKSKFVLDFWSAPYPAIRFEFGENAPDQLFKLELPDWLDVGEVERANLERTLQNIDLVVMALQEHRRDIEKRFEVIR